MSNNHYYRNVVKCLRIIIVGGTGFLGYHAILAGLKSGHDLAALSIDDVVLGDWFPKQVAVHYGDVFKLSVEELQKYFADFDAMIYAIGPDDRVVPSAPAYNFFYSRLVEGCEKVVIAARRAGVKKCVVLNSYFAYYAMLCPNKKLSEHHPYIRCRIEQARRAIAAGQEKMAVIVLQLPYIFGSMPGRVPLWKDVILDRFTTNKVVFFPKGGTNMIAAVHVGEAIIGAVEHGVHGKRYLIGDENCSYLNMIKMMLSAVGLRKIIILLPRFICVIIGIMYNRRWRKQGLEGGLDARYIMRDIITHNLYFDPSESAKALGYLRGGLKQSIFETMRACYPEKFTN